MIKTAKRYVLRLATGHPVWTDGRLHFSMEMRGSCNQVCDATGSGSSPKSRQMVAVRAHEQLGASVEWHEQGTVEYIDV